MAILVTRAWVLAAFSVTSKKIKMNAKMKAKMKNINVKITVVLIVGLFLCFGKVHANSVSAAQINQLYETGFGYLQAKRYRDAEVHLMQLVNHVEFSQLEFGPKVEIRSGYETALLFQGKNERTQEEMEETLAMYDAENKNNTLEHAVTLINYAEVHYRQQKPEEGIEIVEQSIAIVEKLGSEYDNFVVYARQTIDLFNSERWDENNLPLDLSDFFTRCESIDPKSVISSARNQLSAYVELGKNYTPTGTEAEGLAQILSEASAASKSASDGSESTGIVFIPTEQVDADWCVVFHNSGVVESVVVSSVK